MTASSMLHDVALSVTGMQRRRDLHVTASSMLHHVALSVTACSADETTRPTLAVGEETGNDRDPAFETRLASSTSAVGSDQATPQHPGAST